MAEQNYWAGVFQRRLTRRRALGAAGALGLGMVAAACSGQEAKPSAGTGAVATTPSGQPKKGGTLNIYGIPNAQMYGSMDPHCSVWTFAFSAPATNQLVRRDLLSGKYDIIPDLAQSWEQPDETTYVFKMHQGVKFHNLPPVNGRECTSEDMKYSVERIGTNDPKFFRRAEFKGVKIEAPDKYTIKFTTDGPMPSFMLSLATAGTVAVAKEFIDSEGGLYKSGKPFVGTGPFIHTKWELDQTWEFVRNPEYFKKGLPYLDGASALNLPDVQSRMAAFKARKIDLITSLFHPQIEELEKDVQGVKVIRQLGFQTHRVLFNLQKKPWDDVRVRKAVHLAIDRWAIADLGYFTVEALPQGYGGITPEVHGEAAIPRDELNKMPGYRKDKKQDLEDAKRLLAEAGYPGGGIKAEMPYSTFVDSPQEHVHAQTVQANLKQIGIEVTLKTQDYSDSLVQLASGDFGIFDTRQWATNPDPDAYLVQYASKGGPRNYGKWDNAKFNELLAKEGKTVNVKDRATIIRDMLKILEEEMPMAWTINWLLNATTQPYVRGYAQGLASDTTWETIWLDK